MKQSTTLSGYTASDDDDDVPLVSYVMYELTLEYRYCTVHCPPWNPVLVQKIWTKSACLSYTVGGKCWHSTDPRNKTWVIAVVARVQLCNNLGACPLPSGQFNSLINS